MIILKALRCWSGTIGNSRRHLLLRTDRQREYCENDGCDPVVAHMTYFDGFCLEAIVPGGISRGKERRLILQPGGSAGSRLLAAHPRVCHRVCDVGQEIDRNVRETDCKDATLYQTIVPIGDRR